MLADGSPREKAWPLYAVCALLAAGLLIYSQTKAFAWDEGFHLVAAQLIKAGKKPFLDWMFPQAPLNAYWNALWMALFGESWRTTHVAAALCSSAAAFLTGCFVFRKFPVPSWRLPLAIFCAVSVGTNISVVEFGAIAQAYGLCLLGIVAAFCFATMAVDRETFFTAFAAGLTAGIAMGSSLLTAPVAPILILWILLCNRAGSRLKKFAAFLAGGIVAFLPILRLFAEGPRQSLFSMIQYHLYYRQVDWPGAIRHDFETMAGLINFPQGLLLCLLALAGLLFVYYRSGWDRARKQEFYLCALMALAIAAYLCTVHPTFARYFLFTTPFLTYLAAAGLYYAGSALWSPDRPGLPVAVLCILMTLAVAKELYDTREDLQWRTMEKVAAKVREVAPPDHTLLADEAVYFLLHRLPPSGLENRDSHKLDLPPDRAALFHVIPEATLQRQIQAGRFSVIERCDDDDWFDTNHVETLYANHEDFDNCKILWGWKGAGAK